MAKKKKKGVLNSILGITANVSDIATGVYDNILDIEKIYNVGKDITVSSSDLLLINENKEKIRKLLIEIGDRIYEKQIEVDDRNVKAEVECIKELNNERPQ